MEQLKSLASQHETHAEAKLYTSYLYSAGEVNTKMDRILLIKWLIQQYDYTSYLHIGGQPLDVGLQDTQGVHCDAKGTEQPATSSAFFQKCQRSYDLIFLNGRREMQQALRDVADALAHLKEGGTVILHHCLPRSSLAATWPLPRNAYYWSGETWRAWMHLQNRSDLSTFLLDADWGLGIIRQGKQTPTGIAAGKNWADYKRDLEVAMCPKLAEDLVVHLGLSETVVESVESVGDLKQTQPNAIPIEIPNSISKESTSPPKKKRVTFSLPPQEIPNTPLHTPPPSQSTATPTTTKTPKTIQILVPQAQFSQLSAAQIAQLAQSSAQAIIESETQQAIDSSLPTSQGVVELPS